MKATIYIHSPTSMRFVNRLKSIDKVHKNTKNKFPYAIILGFKSVDIRLKAGNAKKENADKYLITDLGNRTYGANEINITRQ